MVLGRRKKSKLAAAVDSSREMARKGGTAVSEEMDHLLGTLSEKVSDARSAISTLSEEGAVAAREALDTVVKETRAGVKKLDKKWKKMTPKQKVAVVGGLLAVLAAAAGTAAAVKKARKKRRR
jgi:ABC-type transporter MlaC component